MAGDFSCAWTRDQGICGLRVYLCSVRSTKIGTATLLPDLSTVLCSNVTVSATGEAAELWPGSLDTFPRLPGEFYRGCQIFKNTTTGWGLRVRPLPLS